MRVAFLGNDPWSVPPLEALADAPGIEVALVVTNPPRPAGRGSELRPTIVSRAARRLGLPMVEAARVRDGEGLAALRAAAPDAVAVVAYGEILTPDVLGLPRLGCVNVHFSLLPRWRGAAPVQRAILEGDAVTGVSVMLMDEGLDTGPVLARREEPILPADDAGALGARLAAIGGPMLVETLRALDAGTATPVPQDPDDATRAPKIAPDERSIDWGRPVDAIARRVRALAPEPGAETSFRGRPLKVLRVETVGAQGRTSPGRLATSAHGPPSVEAADGLVRLLDVVPAGRRRMSGADWARGARVEPGERLG